MILAAVWSLVVFCLFNQIRLAVKVNEVAARFVYNTPYIILVPLIQMFVCAFWFLCWLWLAAIVLTQERPAAVSTDAFASEEAAMESGCVGGYAFHDPTMCDGTKCWRCYPERYTVDWRFYYQFFSYLWAQALLCALGMLIVAGSCAAWFFTENERKGRTASVLPAVKNALFKNFGSAAFGALILAIVQFLKYVCKYFSENETIKKSMVLIIVVKCVECALWCLEKCLKFFNRHAYIQVSIHGTNFCRSGINAFGLLIRNAARFGVLYALGSVINYLGLAFITVGTGVVGYVVLQLMYPEISPVLPVMMYLFMGYVTAQLFLNVFSLAVDTTLQCFIATEEIGDCGDFVPEELAPLITKISSSKKSGGRCCGRC
jgi:hypothetical protein